MEKHPQEIGQIRYGADVINRIIESAKPGGRRRLQKAVIDETINPLIQQMCRAAKFPNKQIYRMCVAGNTTMNHLFAGVNADPVRMEPYIPTFYKTNSLYASDLGLTVNPDAHIIIAPNIGSYVAEISLPVHWSACCGINRNFLCLSTLEPMVSWYLVTLIL